MNRWGWLLDAAVSFYGGALDLLLVTLSAPLRKTGEEKGWDLDKRQKLPSPVRDFRGKNVVWLHASSLGEAKLLVKFYAMLHERHPEDLYLVTATTRTGVAFLEKNRKNGFCAIGFQPIDTGRLVSRIIDHYSVKRLWLMETELWPSLLRVCARRCIPVGIVNGRIEERSFSRYCRRRPFFAWLLSHVDLILAQSEQYAQRFVELGVRRELIHVVGNIKGHIRVERPQKQEWLDLRRSLNIDEESFVVTAGCIHAGEGGVLHAFMKEMERLGYPCKLIVVPRYCNETAPLLDEIGANAVHLTECSTARRWNVCIIEKTGILDDMYKAADAAVVGGTFIDIGGHNVWDAACYAIPVFFGPHCETQRESCEQLLEAGVGFMAEDGMRLAETVFNVVKRDPMRFVRSQERFIEATNKTRSIVEPLLP